jgi:hypothetical protein
MVESPMREFVLPPDFDKEIRMRVALREGRDMEEEERIEKEMREKGRKRRALESIFDDHEEDDAFKESGEQKRQDCAAEDQSEKEQKSVEISEAPKKSIDAEAGPDRNGLATPESSKKFESDDEQRAVKNRVAMKDSGITKEAGGVPATNDVGKSRIASNQEHEKVSRTVEVEKSAEQTTAPELENEQHATKNVVQRKETEQTKASPVQQAAAPAPKPRTAVEPRPQQNVAQERPAPKKLPTFIDLTDSVIDLTGDD